MIQDDEEGRLLQAAIQGDRSAYGSLYERYYDSIYRYIYFRVGDSFDADDLTATVFIRAWESLPTYRLRVLNFRSWLYRIAHNLVIDQHRTQKDTFSLEQVIHHADQSDPPEKVNQTNEDARNLAKKIRQLDPILQEVILCRFVMEMSHAETAQAMVCSESYVRVLQYRALRKLRESMQLDGKDEYS